MARSEQQVPAAGKKKENPAQKGAAGAKKMSKGAYQASRKMEPVFTRIPEPRKQQDYTPEGEARTVHELLEHDSTKGRRGVKKEEGRRGGN